MSLLSIHNEIKEKLRYFYNMHKIPNIIFHGPHGSGKRTIVQEFIDLIYNHDKERIKSFVMHINCAHGKGIKFIREELKFFAKMHINSNGGDIFKSIVLLNADKLTMDAQSALRRCIELFNHTTRFFIVVEDKYKLLKPILSRFCEIYIYKPYYKGEEINLYKYNVNETFKLVKIKNKKKDNLKKELTEVLINDVEEIVTKSKKLYEKGYSGLDIIELIEQNYSLFPNMNKERQCELLVAFNKVRKEMKNEKLLMLFILNFVYLDKAMTLENISFF
jgi:replication-associated recombination protein RarA